MSGQSNASAPTESPTTPLEVLPSYGQLKDDIQIAQISIICDVQAAPDHGADPPQGDFELVNFFGQ